MPRPAALAGIALMLCAFALPAAAARLKPGEEAVQDVRLRIESGDCAGAARELNEGLVKNYPEVNLLAGSMFDNGVCLKADWNKAVHFYVKAYGGGQKAALYRLAAGFAAPERGPDVAAALWWASRDGQDGPARGCRVSAASIADPDRFVAELQTWPRPRLAACNYMAGVLATLSGEIRYPDTAQTYSLGGDFTLRFLPAVPSVEIKAAETTEYQMLGVVNGDSLRDRSSSRITGSFQQELRKVVERALKRYPQPAGIDPAAEALIQFHFLLD